MKTIAKLLVEHDIVKVNFKDPYTWTSGIKSPIYCDCRELTGLPEARNQIVNVMVQKIKEIGLEPQATAGTATAGISWAAWVADKLDIPMCYVRSKPKGHGAGKMVEGRIGKNQKIIVIEDAFSTGGSSIKSAEALKSELNAEVSYIFGIFSWDTPQFFENVEASGLNMISFTNFHEIADALLESGKITPEQKIELEKFHNNPNK